MAYALPSRSPPSGCVSSPSTPSDYLSDISPSITFSSPAISDLSQFSPASSSTSLSSSNMPPTGKPDLRPEPSPRPLGRSLRAQRRSDSSYVCRPRNAFIIFRSEMCKRKKIITTIEKDHRRISQIIAAYWNSLSDEQKKPWLDKAAAEKEAHRRKHPDYRFSPVNRASPVRRRRTRRNGPVDKERDKRVGAALAAGLEGSKLEDVIKQIDANLTVDQTSATSHQSLDALSPQIEGDCQIFRSPLLPPHNRNRSAPTRPEAHASSVDRNINMGSVEANAAATLAQMGWDQEAVPPEVYMRPGNPYANAFYGLPAPQSSIISPSESSSTSALGLTLQSMSESHGNSSGIVFDSTVGELDSGSNMDRQVHTSNMSQRSPKSNCTTLYNGPVGSANFVGGLNGNYAAVSDSRVSFDPISTYPQNISYQPRVDSQHSHQSNVLPAAYIDGAWTGVPGYIGSMRHIQDPDTQREFVSPIRRTARELSRQRLRQEKF